MDKKDYNKERDELIKLLYFMQGTTSNFLTILAAVFDTLEEKGVYLDQILSEGSLDDYKLWLRNVVALNEDAKKVLKLEVEPQTGRHIYLFYKQEGEKLLQ